MLRKRDIWKSKWRDFRQTMRSPIILKSFMLISSVGLFFLGVGNGFRYQAKVAYERMMNVSSMNTSYQFALSKVSVLFQEQFRSGNLFIMPFRISSFDVLSVDAEQYEVILQGVISDIQPDSYRVKLCLFGQSGQGVLLIEGDFTGEPFNVYLKSLAEIYNISGLVDLSTFEVDRNGVTYQQLLEMEAIEPNSTQYAALSVNGKEVPVTVDMLAVTVNPMAQNVLEIDGLSFDSSVSEIYSAVVADKERAIIAQNRRTLEDIRTKLYPQLEEFERRLERDTTFTPDQVQAIRTANRIALNGTGSKGDLDRINATLVAVGLSADTTRVVDYTDQDLPEGVSVGAVDVSSFTEIAGSDTETVLSNVRDAYMRLNAQLAGYDYQLRVVNRLVEGQMSEASVLDDEEHVFYMPKF